MPQGILVVIEQRQGQLKRQSAQALSKGRALAAEMGEQASALLIGAGVKGLVELLKPFAPGRVYLADRAELADYRNASYSEAVAAAAAAAEPKVILLSATAMGRDLGPLCAARLGCGICSDVTALSLKGGDLLMRKPIYAGRCFANFRARRYPLVISLRPNVFAAAAAEAPADPEVVELATELSGRDHKEVLLVAAEAGELDVAEASLIVTGGRGIKGPENLALIRELAGELGAAVGASRAIVDAGWIDHKHQVGQTGKTVSPNLYFAVGVSGAIQHLAGMSSSKMIVAINRDADAPIFQHSDFGIVGDLFKVLPEVVAGIRQARG